MLNFIIVIGLLLVTLFLGLPVAFSLGVTATFLIFVFDLPINIIGQVIYSSLDSFVLLSIPLFVMMSQILLEGKVGDDLFNVMNVWVRHLPGGLAVATILSCAFFAAITGSSAATAATIGMVAIPALIERGYERRFTLGLLAAGGTLGILIPPSIPMILYGAITEESVGKLFIAGIIPGIILTLIFIIYAVYKSSKGGAYNVVEAASWNERWEITSKNIWGIILPFIIIGGIYTGIFTPTEAAGVGLGYSLFICLFIYKTLKLKDFKKIFLKSVETSCMIALIIAGAILFGQVMTYLEIPQTLTSLVIEKNFSPLMFVIAMNILMLLLGCILETVSIILLTMPLIISILHVLHIDPIWYAVILVINMEMALITPPVGINLYVINGVDSESNMADIIKGVWPFMLLIVLMIVLIIAFPPLCTWLPSIMK
ncbi:MAG TPA: C4-dicarboxylate ABC transporter permease [Candidatus Atribacteria bacterium]|nr:C4-dicarboxylate ABC transporter permease [Candidatus Atribacteria bacterium]